MSMGVIGSAVYVNQQSIDVASLQNGYNSRLEFQHVMAQVIANEKAKEVVDVSATEETQKIAPNKESSQNKSNQNQNRYLQKNTKDTETTLHKLDIKV